MKKALYIVTIILSSYGFAQEAIEEFEPFYPMSPLCMDDSGVVVLHDYILENGRPHMIEIVENNNPRFARSAIKTLLKYEFRPGTYSINIKYQKAFEFKPEVKCGS